MRRYFLYQKKTAFCFGTDAVLLANFAGKRIKKNAKTIDLCTGNGIIPFLFVHEENDLMIDAVEIDSETAQLAEHNISVNALQKKVRMICSDIKDLPKSFYGTYDAVTVNPPYIPLGRGLLPKHRNSVGRGMNYLLHWRNHPHISISAQRKGRSVYGTSQQQNGRNSLHSPRIGSAAENDTVCPQRSSVRFQPHSIGASKHFGRMDGQFFRRFFCVTVTETKQRNCPIFTIGNRRYDTKTYRNIFLLSKAELFRPR